MPINNPAIGKEREIAPVAPTAGPAASWSSLLESLPAQRTIHSIDLDVTEACNLACIYCFKWQKKAVHMDEAIAKQAIDWLIEASGNARELKVNLMGGEPLLRFDLIQKIVPYGKLRARQRGKSLHFGCTTNCTVLTDEMLAFWRRFGMGFHCSIDGVPEVQDANRPFLGGRGSSSAVAKIAPKILSYRPEVMARATVSPQSVRFLYDSAQYLARLGFRSMTFKIAANCAWSAADFEVLRRQYEQVRDFYLERIVAGQPVKIEEFEKGIQALHSVARNTRFPCGAARGVVMVDPRGDLWPCHRFGPHQCGGQFRLGRLGEPFNERMRDVFLNYSLLEDSRAGCAGCRAALTCRSWCYAECVDSTQTFYDPGQEYCAASQIVHDIILQVHDRLRSYHADFLRGLLRPSTDTGRPTQ